MLNKKINRKYEHNKNSDPIVLESLLLTTTQLNV